MDDREVMVVVHSIGSEEGRRIILGILIRVRRIRKMLRAPLQRRFLARSADVFLGMAADAIAMTNVVEQLALEFVGNSFAIHGGRASDQVITDVKTVPLNSLFNYYM